MLGQLIQQVPPPKNARYSVGRTGGSDAQVTVVDTSNVQVVHPIATTASTRKPPLLALELQVSEGTSITCKTDLDSIVPRMLAVFDKAITATQVSDALNVMRGSHCRSTIWAWRVIEHACLAVDDLPCMHRGYVCLLHWQCKAQCVIGTTALMDPTNVEQVQRKLSQILLL